MTAGLVEESSRLHERVLAFVVGAAPTESFADLARELADFQARYSTGFARLLATESRWVDDIRWIPGVPTDAFRLTRIAVHPPALDVARFHTSGTTGSARGEHVYRTLDTYREVALSFGRRALLGKLARATVVSLAPMPSEPPESSLGFMMRLFQDAWDSRNFDGSAYQSLHGERWLVGSEGVDVAGLERATSVARQRREPLVILTTAFALVNLLDRLAGATLQTPEGTVVMVTGGFKGRTREVESERLRSDVARSLSVTEAHVIGEYGMTELTSQLYEGTLPEGDLRSSAGVFLEPGWLRVVPVDPVTLSPVPDGEIGLAKIIDLANVDSAVAVQTQDRVRRVARGIELLGRAPGAPPRGCSLALESLLS